MSLNRAAALIALPLVGCLNLDFVIHNPVHCSNVGPATCEEKSGPWDQTCVPCEVPYDFERDYPWMDGTLSPGQTVRPIPTSEVVPMRVPTTDGLGELDAYWIPAHGDDAVNARITLIYHHGNYVGIEHYLPRVRFLYEGGYNLLVWDYRGYGKSAPATLPTGPQWDEDAAQMRALAKELAPDPGRIAYYGYSLGAVPAVMMALQEPACALLLEAPFTSLEQLADSNAGVRMPGSFLSTGYYENTEKIKDYPGPVMVMAGTADQLFVIEDTRELYENAPGPKLMWELEGVGHGVSGGGVPEAGLSAYLSQIRGFLQDKAPACLGQ